MPKQAKKTQRATSFSSLDAEDILFPSNEAALEGSPRQILSPSLNYHPDERQGTVPLYQPTAENLFGLDDLEPNTETLFATNDLELNTNNNETQKNLPESPFNFKNLEPTNQDNHTTQKPSDNLLSYNSLLPYSNINQTSERPSNTIDAAALGNDAEQPPLEDPLDFNFPLPHSEPQHVSNLVPHQPDTTKGTDDPLDQDLFQHNAASPLPEEQEEHGNLSNSARPPSLPTTDEPDTTKQNYNKLVQDLLQYNATSLLPQEQQGNVDISTSQLPLQESYHDAVPLPPSPPDDDYFNPRAKPTPLSSAQRSLPRPQASSWEISEQLDLQFSQANDFQGERYNAPVPGVGSIDNESLSKRYDTDFPAEDILAVLYPSQPVPEAVPEQEIGAAKPTENVAPTSSPTQPQDGGHIDVLDLLNFGDVGSLPVLDFETQRNNRKRRTSSRKEHDYNVPPEDLLYPSVFPPSLPPVPRPTGLDRRSGHAIAPPSPIGRAQNLPSPHRRLAENVPFPICDNSNPIDALHLDAPLMRHTDRERHVSDFDLNDGSGSIDSHPMRRHVFQNTGDLNISSNRGFARSKLRKEIRLATGQSNSLSNTPADVTTASFESLSNPTLEFPTQGYSKADKQSLQGNRKPRLRQTRHDRGAEISSINEEDFDSLDLDVWREPTIEDDVLELPNPHPWFFTSRTIVIMLKSTDKVSPTLVRLAPHLLKFRDVEATRGVVPEELKIDEEVLFNEMFCLLKNSIMHRDENAHGLFLSKLFTDVKYRMKLGAVCRDVILFLDKTFNCKRLGMVILDAVKTNLGNDHVLIRCQTAVINGLRENKQPIVTMSKMYTYGYDEYEKLEEGLLEVARETRKLKKEVKNLKAGIKDGNKMKLPARHWDRVVSDEEWGSSCEEVRELKENFVHGIFWRTKELFLEKRSDYHFAHATAMVNVVCKASQRIYGEDIKQQVEWGTKRFTEYINELSNFQQENTVCEILEEYYCKEESAKEHRDVVMEVIDAVREEMVSMKKPVLSTDYGKRSGALGVSMLRHNIYMRRQELSYKKKELERYKEFKETLKSMRHVQDC